VNRTLGSDFSSARRNPPTTETKTIHKKKKASIPFICCLSFVICIDFGFLWFAKKRSSFHLFILLASVWFLDRFRLFTSSFCWHPFDFWIDFGFSPIHFAGILEDSGLKLDKQHLFAFSHYQLMTILGIYFLARLHDCISVTTRLFLIDADRSFISFPNCDQKHMNNETPSFNSKIS